jgi:hypothetical protein
LVSGPVQFIIRLSSYRSARYIVAAKLLQSYEEMNILISVTNMLYACNYLVSEYCPPFCLSFKNDVSLAGFCHRHKSIDLTCYAFLVVEAKFQIKELKSVFWFEGTDLACRPFANFSTALVRYYFVGGSCTLLRRRIICSCVTNLTKLENLCNKRLVTGLPPHPYTFRLSRTRVISTFYVGLLHICCSHGCPFSYVTHWVQDGRG